MEIGRFEIEQLSEGFFETFRDGTLLKMNPGRLDDLRQDPVLGKYSTPVGVDPLLVSDGETHLLLDSGLGWGLDHGSRFSDTSNAVTNLAIFDIDPADIDFVVLSHLHYDHSAASTYINSDIETTATFPNAVYLLQKQEWEYAISEESRSKGVPGAGYRMDEMYKLAAEKRFHFIESESYDLIPGIRLLRTGGHTPGHQAVSIQDGGKRAFYPGDLIPTEHHLNHYAMKQLDHDPVQAKKFKTLLLREAFESDACLFFYHSLYKKNGKLQRDRHRKYVLIES